MVSQGVGGHEGYSGTPFWKIQQQNAAQREAALQETLAYAAVRTVPIVPPNVFCGAMSIGGPSARPYARHVIVKCLRKVAQNSQVELPQTGLFLNQAPIGLFALFDGQSGAGEAGPNAAEFCARNFHKKVLENLASLPPGCTDETFIKAILVKSFEDLDKDLLDSQPEIKDGCGAAVALIVGEYLFSAVVGTCDGTLCEAAEASDGSGRVTATAVYLGRNQGRCHLAEERARLQRAGCVVVGDGPTARAHGAPGVSAVSRTLGDLQWKRPAAVLSCIPEIQSCKLSWNEKHQFLMLVSKPVADAIPPQSMVERAIGFPGQPRAACGEITTQAMAKLDSQQQCTAVMVCLLPGGPGGPDADALLEEQGGGEAAEATSPGQAPKKKQKTGSTPVGEIKSARLRHILIKFQDGARPLDGRKAVRTRPEAEALLRQLLREFRIELEELRKKYGKLKRLEDLALKSEKFAKVCKEHSVCPTAQKGGGMCGDLGWMPREAQKKLGIEFQNAVAVLRPGDWSDIVNAADGLHIIQRIA